jgi:hypothetical protein
MALQVRDRLHGLWVRVDRVDTNDRVVGMHIERLREIYDDTTSAVVQSSILPAEQIDFAGLVAIMHPDDIAVLLEAVSARQPQ